MLIPEDEIFERVQQGDTEAFSLLVSLHQTRVFNLCYRMLGDFHLAEDAAQEVFWRAYQGFRRYDRNRSFLTWLLSIAAHYCIDQLRKRRTPLTHIEDWMEEMLPTPEAPPEASYAVVEEQHQVQKLLMQLEANERAILVLRYWYDMNETEIAETLSLSTSAVKSRLYRARQKMARLWWESQSPDTHKEEVHEAPAF